MRALQARRHKDRHDQQGRQHHVAHAGHDQGMPASTALEADPERHDGAVGKRGKPHVDANLLGLQRPIEVIPALKNPARQRVHQKKTADDHGHNQQGELYDGPDGATRCRHSVTV